ncbi:hypothetical protein BU23DRAFT_628670 [Bimuria novae-zelandiae CBS 107.79]|uniref:Uncharacterized protein n=1 Tax=Bimuria novae-zelandiae CBS 107.79 TaxID=1447943 RepID=A0A6A5UQV6_9PLEO|nr:hypothetical protein BU23DRAFT_628670 [Bimuria novae-zelandiae CBS 107.79]
MDSPSNGSPLANPCAPAAQLATAATNNAATAAQQQQPAAPAYTPQNTALATSYQSGAPATPAGDRPPPNSVNQAEKQAFMRKMGEAFEHIRFAVAPGPQAGLIQPSFQPQLPQAPPGAPGVQYYPGFTVYNGSRGPVSQVVVNMARGSHSEAQIAAVTIVGEGLQALFYTVFVVGALVLTRGTCSTCSGATLSSSLKASFHVEQQRYSCLQQSPAAIRASSVASAAVPMGASQAPGNYIMLRFPPEANNS